MSAMGPRRPPAEQYSSSHDFSVPVTFEPSRSTIEFAAATLAHTNSTHSRMNFLVKTV